MNCAFLGMLVPEQMEAEVRALSSHNMQDAANALQWHIYHGLCTNLGYEIPMFTVLPISSYPQYYRKPFVKRRVFSTGTAENNISIGFCNVKVLRKKSIPHGVYRELRKWCNQDLQNRFLFVYTLSPGFMQPVVRLKQEFPDLRVCAIVADLPGMTNLSSNKNWVYRLLEKQSAKSARVMISSVDAFVLLTEQMADYLQVTQPYCVMEGIATKPEEEPDFSPYESPVKRILYSGTLHKRFGVMNLLNAFQMMDGKEYELILCGVGDSEREIQDAAKKDPRIRFLGQLPREDVLRLQKEATVLVNPRQNIEKFTKYSFPSKNLEYLSSGRPLVAYRLDGIPAEYNQYIYYVEDNSVRSLADMLLQVCHMPIEAVNHHCKCAYHFVQTEKNEYIQAQKILKMLSRKGILRKSECK